MALDYTDQWRACCERYAQYPLSLVHAQLPKSILRDWHARLNDAKEKEALFDSDEPEMEIFDLYDKRGVHRATVTNQADLEGHLQQNRKDPRIRYVSVEADSSRDPLRCSPAMMTYLLTTHQIPPSFLSLLYSFGDSLSPLDWHMTSFHPENTLLQREDKLLSIPSIGRSGREMRFSYILRSIERSGATPSWPWGLRQTAVYHSYDIQTGRSVWVTVKGNEVAKEIMSEALSATAELRELKDSFSSSLEIQMGILNWCDSNWRWCINDLETTLRDVITKVRTAEIDSNVPHSNTIPKDIKQYLSRPSTGLEPGSPSRASTAVQKLGTRLASCYKLVKGLSFRPRETIGSQEVHEKQSAQVYETFGQAPAGEGDIDMAATWDNIRKLDVFSIAEVQRLQGVSEKAQEALLVVKLNANVIRQMIEHYEATVNLDVFPQQLREATKSDLLNFKERATGIANNMDMRREQLEALLRLANEGKNLYDGILQYRGVQLSSIYARSAYASSKRMTIIAQKTEEETNSMHIITGVTLFFLPGTFMATVFQSGIISWDNGNVSSGYGIRHDALNLFAIICVCLMVVTFLIWAFMFRYLKRRSKKAYEVLVGPNMA